MKIPRLTLNRKSTAGGDAGSGSSGGTLADLALAGSPAGSPAEKPSFAGSKRHDEPIVGGIPRVSLLPPEMATAAKVRAAGRGLVLLVVGVLLVTGGGVAWTTVEAGAAQTRLADAQTQTRTLLKEQAKYASASDLENLLATVHDARIYGVSTEVDWSEYITSITATMSPGVVMLDATASASAPWEAPLLAAGPLRAARVATVLLRVQSQSEAEISAWVRTLEDLPGFADASIDGWSHDDAGFTASVTLNIAAGAFSGRYTAGDAAGTAADTEPAAALDPAAVDPAAVDPAVTDPAVTDPAATDPAATENGK